MNKAQINELITFIKADATLSPIFGTRVFYVRSLEEQEGNSLYINVLSENRQLSRKESMIEFRVISSSSGVGPVDILDILDKIKDIFEKNSIKIGSEKYYQVDILSDIFVDLNIKQRYEGIITTIFKKSR